MNQAAKRPGKSNRKPRTRQDAQRELTRVKQASEQAWQELLAAPDLMAPPPKPTVYIEQKDGTYLIYEIEPCGRRKRIGRHIPVDFAPRRPS